MKLYSFKAATFSAAFVLAATIHAVGAQTPGTPLITVSATYEYRHDVTRGAGYAFTVGDQPLIVHSVGRYCGPGNHQLHTVKLVRASNQTDLLGGSAQVAMAGCIPGSFQYANLPVTLRLDSNTEYYLVSSETAGGDGWYNQVTGSDTAAARVTAAVVSSTQTGGNADWYTVDPPSGVHGPVNLRYEVVRTFDWTGNPGVVLQTQVWNSKLSGTIHLHVLAVPNGAGLTIAAVALNLDGVPNAFLARSGTSGNNYSVAIDTTGWTNGSHVISITALDSEGHQTTSISAPVTVYNAPGVTIVSPQPHSLVSGVVEVSVHASAPSGATIASFEILVDGTTVGFSAPNEKSPYIIGWSTFGAANGSHQLSARAVDSLGNVMISNMTDIIVNNPY